MTDDEINAMEKLMQEYVRTLNSKNAWEWYTTHRSLATGQLDKFVAWLRKRNAERTT
jgi:hypothetical protein